MQIKIRTSNYYKGKHLGLYHCIDLDFVYWPGKSILAEYAEKQILHEKFYRESICHIYKQAVYCHCSYFQKECNPDEHTVIFLDEEE